MSKPEPFRTGTGGTLCSERYSDYAEQPSQPAPIQRGGGRYKAVALLSVSLALALTQLTASAQTSSTSRTSPCPPAYSPPTSPFLPIWLEDWQFWLPRYSEGAWQAPFPDPSGQEPLPDSGVGTSFLRFPWQPYPPYRCLPPWFPVPLPPPSDWNPPASQDEAIYLGSGTAEVDGAGSVCGVPAQSPLLAATGQTGFHLPMPATSFGHGGWVHLSSPTPGGTWLSQLYSWDRIQLVRVRSRGKGTPIENYQSGSAPEPWYEYILYDASGTASRFVYRNGRFEPAFGVHTQLLQHGDTFTVIGGPPWAIHQKGAWRYGFTGMPNAGDNPNAPWGGGVKAKVLFIRDPLGNTWERVTDLRYPDSVIWRAPNLTMLRFDADGKIYYAENPGRDQPVWQLLGQMRPLVLGSGHPNNERVDLVWYEPDGKHIAFQWWGGVTGNTDNGILSEMRLDSGVVQNGQFHSQVSLRWFFEKNTRGKEAQLYQYLYGESYLSSAYLGRLWAERVGNWYLTQFAHGYLSGGGAETQIHREQMPVEAKTFLTHRWNSQSDKFTELEVRRPRLFDGSSPLGRDREVVVLSSQNGKPVARRFYARENDTTPTWEEQYRYEYAANPDVLTTFVDRQGNEYRWAYEEREAQRWHPEIPQSETVLRRATDPTGVFVQLEYGEQWRDFDVEWLWPNPPLVPSSVQLGTHPDRRWRFQSSWDSSLNPPAPNGLLRGFSEPGRGWWKIWYTPAWFRQAFQPCLVIDPTGRFVQIRDWDSRGRATRLEAYPKRSSSGLGWDLNSPLYTQVEYTAFGQVKSVRTGYASYSPQQVEYVWNGLQLQEYVDPRGRRVRFEYVPGSGELSHIYVDNRLYAQLGYDWYGRLGRVAGGNNVGVRYEYGYRDELVRLHHDGDLSPERFFYLGCCGQVGRWVRPDGQEVRFDYTPNGWLQEVYLPLPLGERQQLAYYEYDTAGRLTLAQDALTTRRFTYDTADADRTGWLESSSVQFEENGARYQWNYTYYLSGDVRTVQLTGPGGLTNVSSQGFVYDGAGRLTSHTYQRGEIHLTINYEYDGAGRVTKQTVQVDNTTLLTDIAYADHQSVGSIWWFNTYLNNLPIATFTYSYYPDGTVQSVQENVGGRATRWSWDYYADGSLKYEQSPDLSEGVRNYAYDAGGNLLRLPTLPREVVPAYSYNKLVQAGTWRFSYTQNGERAGETNNPVAGYAGNWEYAYDVWGNLIRASRNGQVVYAAKYDAFGNRVWARIAGLGERSYVYEGDTLVAELDGSGNLIAEYVWGLLGPVARVERVPDPWFPRYRVQLYVLDGLGHVRGLMGRGSSGAWVWTDSYRYDSWGNLLAREGDTQQPFLWNGAYGYEYIPATGLYHVGAREYDPRTGRWLQRDPIDASAGDPNLYRYCGNDPINGWDTGEQADKKSPQAQQNQAQSKAQQATQGIPPGAEVCPRCNGTGILCDGLHQQDKKTSFLWGLIVMVSETEWVVFCGECNGLGYRPKGGWSGKKEDQANPIVASSPDKDKLSPEERKAVDERGNRHGCHTCGTKDPKTDNGHWIPDHCPPSSLRPHDQTLRPHCQECSRRQGGKISGSIIPRLKSWGYRQPGPPKKPCSGRRCGGGTTRRKK